MDNAENATLNAEEATFSAENATCNADNSETPTDIYELLFAFQFKAFEAGACEEGSLEKTVTDKCRQYLMLDYSLSELDNTNGVLSSRYPGKIFIPEHERIHLATNVSPNNPSCLSSVSPEKLFVPPGQAATYSKATEDDDKKHESENKDSSKTEDSAALHNFVTFASPSQRQQQQSQQQQQTIYEDPCDTVRVRELIGTAKYARCRQRFVVPVILFRGKFICRSATISVIHETYTRKVVDYAFDYLSGNYTEPLQNYSENVNDPTDESLIPQNTEPSPFSYEEAIRNDVDLLNSLNVKTIIDLMVEMRKVKYYLTVSSSEKADPEPYTEFNIVPLPYPGCEFFLKFRQHDYNPEGLKYDWTLSFNDANINVPANGPAAELNIDWTEFRSWDLITITQNYLKCVLKYLQDESGGLLIHCISGWDRTPLFVSLVRLSLWADGLIHQSLDCHQMAYLTVAYDWYLFGHQLPDRIKRCEDIMLFCFYFLKHISDDDFSIVEHSRKRTKTTSSSGSCSVQLFRPDSAEDDSSKDKDFPLSLDHDSNDSVSNASGCDIVITDNFFGTTPTNTAGNNPLTSKSPNVKRTKTSPISVPCGRQRYESTSSNGSWQGVNEAGSIESVRTGSFMRRAHQQDDGSSHNPNNSLSPNSSSNKDSSNSCDNPPKSLRAQRLQKVRAYFINQYFKAVGIKIVDGTNFKMPQTLLDTLAATLFAGGSSS